MPASRSATPFGDQRDAQPLRPGVQRRPGDRDRAVPVAVGLHHGPHGRRSDRGAQHRDVVRDRVEVDLGPRPTVGRRHDSSVRATLRASSRKQLEDVAGDEARRAARARAASACTHAAAAAARSGSTPVRASSRSCQPARRPCRPSPAVRRRGRPPAPRPSGRPRRVVGPFSSTVHRSSAASVAGRGEPVGPRAATRSAARTRRRAASARSGASRPAPAADRPVGAPAARRARHRRRRSAASALGDQPADRGDRRRPRGRGRGRRTSAPNRDDVRRAPRRPTRSSAIGGWSTSTRHGARRRPAPTPPRARRRCAAPPREHSPAAPRIAGLPATTRTAPFHLWASARPARPPRRRRRRRRRGAPSRRDASSPMSTTSTSPASAGPVAEQQPRLERLERDRALGGRAPRPPCSPVAGVEPARDVDGEHRCVADVAAALHGVRHDRGTRCRTRRRSRDRRPGASAGQSAASNTRTAHAAARAASRAATRPSAPLLPGPAITTTVRPYAPPSIRSAARPTASPARSISSSTGSGAAASIARISSAVTIGITTPNLGAAADRRRAASAAEQLGPQLALDELAVGVARQRLVRGTTPARGS